MKHKPPSVQRFADRVKKITERYESNLSKVAKHIGVSKQALSNWKCGINVPSESEMRKLAIFYGVNWEWLKGKSEIEFLEECTIPPERSKITRRRGQRIWIDHGGGEQEFSLVPQIGGVEAGPMAAPAEDVRLEVERLPHDWIGRLSELGIDCISIAETMLPRRVKNSTVIGLRLSGRSMFPEYLDGDTVLVEMADGVDLQPNPNDHVVVDIGHGRYVLKIWWPKIRALGSINGHDPSFQPIPFNDQMHFYGVVIGLIRKRAR